jgi:hypothetical protein
MSECKCGYTKDIKKNCDGSHKTVKKVKEDLIKKIDEIDIGNSDNQLNAIGMKMMVKDLLK